MPIFTFFHLSFLEVMKKGERALTAMKRRWKHYWKHYPIFADTTRSRYTSKSRPPCFLAPGYTALGLNAGKPCRLSRELGATIYCKNWEARRNKLAVLYPLRFEGHECRVPPLQAIIGREDGHTHTYYSSEPLQSSPSAVWMLHASDSKQKAYSRLPLLLTPSTSLQFPKDSRQP